MRGFTKVAMALAVVAGTTAARAASITVTDCGAAPVTKVGKRTVINRSGDDVAIQCALLPLDGTQRVEVVAKSIVVDGPNGGSVAAGGKGLAIDLRALGTGPGGRSVFIDDGNLTAANNNGSLEVEGPGAIEILKSALAAGDFLRVTCTGAGCPITMNDVTTNSGDLEIAGQGTVTIASSTLRTESPLDRIDITSATGDVLMGTSRAAGTVCRDDILALCPGPNCPLPVVIETPEDAVAFCECDDEPNEVETGIEGNLFITAAQGDIDLRGAVVRVGENIDITAQGDVNMTDASIQNCGPKNGRFTVTGSACQIGGATLLDDQPEPQPTLSCAVSGTPTQLGTCN